MNPFLCPDELEKACRDAAAPIRLGVIGNPIAHSRSPQMQQAALDADGRALRYVRLLCGTGEGDFAALLRLLADLRFIGANVTVPFKKQAYEACASTDALAALCGAVNTLRRREDGSWEGFNTDGPGFSRAIQEETARPLASHRVLILGACGGAGSALACQCALEGCPALTLVNRPRPELGMAAERLAPLTRGVVRCACFGDPALADRVAEAELIVNATSLGLREGDALPLDPSLLRPGQYVCDIVPHDTPLRRAAEARGCLTANGLGMLLWQGALSYEHWFGRLPDTDLMRRALADAE